MKKISIIIPVWNSEKYIKKAIDGILAQKYDNLELIIVNDGSVDNTAEVIHQCEQDIKKAGITMKYIEQKNRGVGQAFANALKKCTGDYLYWQDSDDWLSDGALKVLSKELDNNPEIALVRGGVNIYNEKLEKESTRTGKNLGMEKKLFTKYLYEKDTVNFVGIFLARMSIVRKRIPGLDIYPSAGGQNWQMLLPITYKNLCKTIDVPVYNYLVRGDSHSHREKTTKELLKKCDIHKDILKNTISRISIMSLPARLYYYLRVDYKYIKKKSKLYIKNMIRRKNVD